MTDRSTRARPIIAVTFTRRAALGLALASLVTVGWAQDALPRWAMQWPETDFGRAAVPLEEILSGGVARDGIPAISDPEMMAADDETRLAPREPVMTVEIEGAATRAYPLHDLTWHEIVNDEIGGYHSRSPSARSVTRVWHSTAAWMGGCSSSASRACFVTPT